MYDIVIPDIERMGGNSLTNGSIMHIDRPNAFLRFLGVGALLPPAKTTVYGQVE